MSPNDNEVYVKNDTAEEFTATMVFHNAGGFVASKDGQWTPALQQTTPIAPGAASNVGGTNTSVGSSYDWWVIGLIAEKMEYVMEPKRCQSPRGGKTAFVITGPTNGAFTVEIQTMNPDGSSDGSCWSFVEQYEKNTPWVPISIF